MIEERIKELIRDVKDFPKQGIVFKDITPLLQNADICAEIAGEFCQKIRPLGAEAIAGIESRGFLFGMMLAQRLGLPFIPIRKQGKLPYHKVSYIYDLEYGTSAIEIHKDSIVKGQRVLIHDDLLATGGTVSAASELVKGLGGEIAGYAFLISLDFLKGKSIIRKYSKEIISLVNYN
jgi:adenine phosphoribosyltransferase